MKMNIPYSYKFAERFLIFITIASFFNCILSILKDITDSYGKNIISITTIIICSVFALIVFSIIAIFFNNKTKLQNVIRLVVYYSICCGLIAWFLRNYVNFIILIICCILMSVLYNKIFEAFFEHDCFERQCAAKNNTLLQKELYDYNLYLTEAAEGYKQNRFILTIMMCILAIVAGTTISTGMALSLFSIITFIVFVICVYIHLFLYAHYVREAVFASDGFTNVFDFRLKIIFVCTLIFSVALVLGLLVSSNHSPLKLSYLIALFKLFKKDSPSNPAPAKQNSNPEIFSEPLFDTQMLNTDVEQTDNKGAYIFTLIISVVFAGTVLWFFISPFIKHSFSKAFRNADLKTIFKKLITHIKEMFKNLFSKRIKLPVINSEGSRRFGQDMEEFLKRSRKSREKKAELDRLTKQFMKIIDWGTSKGFEYSKNLAPAEYTQKLNKASAVQAGNIFEKALYDKECLLKQEEELFIEMVNQTVLSD